MPSIIEISRLKKSFGKTAAVNDLSLEVRRGEVFGLIGPDGAGKSTTLRLLAGLLKADDGSIMVVGTDVRQDQEAVKGRIGYMPQQFSLYGDLSVEENLDFFASMFFVPKAKRKERFDKLYSFSRLKPFADRRAEKLSGGMQKKLALSCILLHQPDLLLLDEPTTGVDPVSRRELWEMLYQLVAEGLSILVSTPYMDEAERCHRVGLIHQGQMLRIDTPQAVRESTTAPLLKVSGPDAHRIVRLLSQDKNVLSVYPAGGSVHAVLKVEPEEAPSIASGWLAAHSEIQQAELVRPTFEDAFIRIVENG